MVEIDVSKMFYAMWIFRIAGFLLFVCSCRKFEYVAFAGQSYAEIEVMKMVMILTAPSSGTVHYVKRAGAVLESGSIVAR